MLLAYQWAALAAISMMLGLMRWPTVHWHLAQLQPTATAEQQQVITAVFDGLNTYLGNYIGEFLGELSVNMFFLLSSWTLLRFRATPHWVAVLGVAVACAGFIGMFRNVTAVVAPVAAINNYLLPLWMIVFGVVLLRHRLPDPQIAGAQQALAWTVVHFILRRRASRPQLSGGRCTSRRCLKDGNA